MAQAKNVTELVGENRKQVHSVADRVARAHRIHPHNPCAINPDRSDYEAIPRA
jgi:hypothetical protein